MEKDLASDLKGIIAHDMNADCLCLKVNTSFLLLLHGIKGNIQIFST